MAQATVKIESKDFEGGAIIINADEFDEKKHKLYVEPESKAGKSLGAGGGENEPVEWTLAKLTKLNKDELIERAKEDKGLDYPTPDDVTKEQIAQAYLDAK